MAEINWLDGEANFGRERICPGQHILQTEWQPVWNDVFGGSNHYDYISDYDCIFSHPINLGSLSRPEKKAWDNLQAAKEQGFGITIENMGHFTQPAAADAIVESGGFNGGMKKINEDKDADPVRDCFSWWSPIFEGSAITEMREHLQGVLTSFFREEDNIENIAAQFASSDAFKPNRKRYGKEYFQCTFDELCDFYKAFIGDDLQYRVLGTFLYKQEIMHAVLVCGEENGAGVFADCPLIPVLGNVVTRDDSGNWTWYPQATGTEIERLDRYVQDFPMYRRWEHVAFAFHLPEDEIMPVDGLASRRHQIEKKEKQKKKDKFMKF